MVDMLMNIRRRPNSVSFTSSGEYGSFQMLKMIL